MTASLYRPIITAATVERAVRAHVERWAADYMAEVAAQHGYHREYLAPFRSYVPSLDAILEAPDVRTLPAAIIVCSGTAEVAKRDDGRWEAAWEVAVGVVGSGQTQEGTYENVGLMLGAVRTLMLQHPSCGVDWVEGSYWEGERMDALPGVDSRTLAAGEATFTVVTPAAVDSRGGTPVPVPDPIAEPQGWGRVQAVDVETRELEP